MLEVRGSEYQDFLRCRLRWKYRWVDGLVSKAPNSKLFFGTLFHKFLEEWYKTGDHKTAEARMYETISYEDANRMEDYEELIQTLQAVIDNYVNTYGDDFDKYEVIETELQFKIPLDDKITFTGTIDLVLREKETGDIYFMDHKTTASIDKYEKNSIMDRQISRYWWALQQLGYDVKGFIYNIILKDYPVPPKVLKNGELSKSKSQKTTYKLYMNSLIESNLTQDEIYGQYGDILNHLSECPKEFFRRTNVYRNQAEIDASIQEFYATAREVDYYRFFANNDVESPYDPIFRNITNDCHWDCSYKDVCVAGFDGSNVDFLINSLYNKEEK